MNIDQACKDALKRINETIEKAAKQRKKHLFKLFYPIIEPGIPLAEVQSKVTLTIHTEEEFYRCVNWCNARIGKGSQYWTARGRIHRKICPTKAAYDPPAVNEWVCFVPGIDLTPLLGFTRAL